MNIKSNGKSRFIRIIRSYSLWFWLLVFHFSASGTERNFIQLLSNPQNIYECTAKVCQYDDLQKTNSYYVLLRWQPNAFLYREMPSRDALSTDKMWQGYSLFGEFGDYYAILDSAHVNYFSFVCTSNSYFPVRFRVQNQFLIYAAYIYSFGFFDTLPGTVKFTNDTIVTFTNASSVKLDGSLIRSDSSSNVLGLNLTTAFKGHQAHWQIKYDYDKEINPSIHIPSRVTASVFIAGKPKVQFTVDYISFFLGRSNLPASYFSMDQFIKAGAGQLCLSSNGQVVVSTVPKLPPSGATNIENINVGEPALDFSLMDLSEHPVTLNSFRGKKVVLLDFWATWCVPCQMTMPGLQDLADKFQNKGLEILSVNEREQAENVRDFVKRRKYTFRVLLDQGGAVGSKYGVQAIPALVLVDKRGLVQWIRVGYSPDEDDLKRLIEKLAKE